jgi:hypothetical protein
MKITIEPLTQYNAFIDEPNGLYTATMVIDHNCYTPISDFKEKEIPKVIEKLKDLLKFFKGEHIILIFKLIKCKSYEHKNIMKGVNELRNWKIIYGNKIIEIKIDNPQSVKVIAVNERGLSGSGWNLRVEFGIEGISNHNFGVICSSYKSAKEYWESKQKSEYCKEIIHWIFEETRRSRKVKCNICQKQLVNLTAQQCSECGKYFCDECMTLESCPDCQGED